MNKLWDRETLRFVDRWACKDGMRRMMRSKGTAASLSRRRKMTIKIIEEMKSSEIMLYRVRLMKKGKTARCVRRLVGVLHCEFGIT